MFKKTVIVILAALGVTAIAAVLNNKFDIV